MAKRKNEEFQEKLLNAITAPAPAPVEAPEPEQEYIDLAFAAIIKKMKKTLNDNEIMDAVEELELVINRICRKRGGGWHFNKHLLVLKISLRHCNQ